MARILIVGCGCRGMALGQRLRADGHAVRGTTRDPNRQDPLAAAGIEPYVGDPDQIGTLMYALEGVTVLCWLLGSAIGSAAQVAALHDTRLEMMLRRSVDTPVRGVVYESAGSVACTSLQGGREVVLAAQATWDLPAAFIDTPPDEHAAWLADGYAAVNKLLAIDSLAEPRVIRG